MSLNDTVSAERVHIAFLGLRNAGKSSLVNAVTGQELAVVSEVKGTTTDPVKKAMELLPIGPVLIIDTPGLDDAGALGEKRVQKARQVLAQTDLAVLVVDAAEGLRPEDRAVIALFEEGKLPYVIAWNKADLLKERPALRDNELFVSAKTGENVRALKDKLGSFARQAVNKRCLVADLLRPGDTVVLVIPIDESAPKGRLILPQQQTMRDILDAHCSLIACQDTELKQALDALSVKPRLVITDSQAFARVAKDTPEDILLTSFSILFARYKGDLAQLVHGAERLKQLRDGDKVLISEGCTHHRQCGDIGTVKLPAWIKKATGASPDFRFTSGGDFPDFRDMDYDLIIHCGGCMLSETEMCSRLKRAETAGIPVVNYGIAIAALNGILKRSLGPFPEIASLLS